MSRRFKLLFICTFFLFCCCGWVSVINFQMSTNYEIEFDCAIFCVLLLILLIFFLFLLNCYIMTLTTAKKLLLRRNATMETSLSWPVCLGECFFFSFMSFFHRMNILNITRIANSHLFFGKHHDLSEAMSRVGQVGEFAVLFDGLNFLLP